MDVSNIGAMIRLPFELLGKIINFILNRIIEISIIVGSIWFVYWMYSSGVVRRIVEAIESRRKKKEAVYCPETSFNGEIKND